MARGNEIWIRVAGGGGTTYWINPPSLNVNWIEVDGPPGHQENIGEQGSLWWYDWPTGVVNRQEGRRRPHPEDSCHALPAG
jgi:hypothetical protein